MNIRIKFKDEWLLEYRNKSEGKEMVPAWIFFENGGECYPDDDWIDNPAVLFGWWLHTITELLQGREGQGFDFMEGPFFIKAYVAGDTLHLVSEDGKISWDVNIAEFSKELIRAMSEVARKFYDSELIELSEGINQGIKKLKSVLLARGLK